MGRKVEIKGATGGCMYALYTGRYDGFVYTHIEAVHDAEAAASFYRYIRIAVAIKFYGRASRERRLFRTR